MRPRGVVVQLGLGGDMSLPMGLVTTKELDLRGSFRFHEEFAEGVAAMRAGRIDVAPLLTHTVGLDEARAGFELAGDRGRAIKVQIRFDA
jgi:L-idonate 5-dehydrogenase